MKDGLDKAASRRQVGRQMLSLSHSLGRVIAAFEKTKDDPKAKPEARKACDEALSELYDAMESLADLRETLRPTLYPEAYPEAAAHPQPRLSLPRVSHAPQKRPPPH